jgi:hypothetical protein
MIVYATIRFVKREPVIFPEGIRIRARPRRESVTGGHDFIHRPIRRIRPKLCVGESNRRNCCPRRSDVSLKGNCRRLRNRRRDLIGKRLQKPAYGGRQSTIIQRWAFSVSFNGRFGDKQLDLRSNI